VDPLIVKGWDCSFTDNVSIFKDILQNNDTIPELVQHFFHFYANFDFTTQLISTKSGLTKHKSLAILPQTQQTDHEIREISQNELQLTPIICIEDPFELTHNLCAKLNIQTFDKFCEYFKHISNSKLLFNEKNAQNSSQPEPNDNYWGLSSLCVEWDPTPNGYIFPEHFIGYINLDLILKHGLNETTVNIMKTIANGLTEQTFLWLSDVYRMDCELLAKWDLIIGQLSPFVEFYIKLWDLDNRVIDLNTRLQFRQQISAEEMKQMSPIDAERYVTQSIINEFSSERSDAIPTECHFALVMNCRLSFPTVELVLIDMKPDFEMRSNLSTFLRRLIASAAHHCQLLTVPKEFI